MNSSLSTACTYSFVGKTFIFRFISSNDRSEFIDKISYSSLTWLNTKDKGNSKVDILSIPSAVIVSLSSDFIIVNEFKSFII